MTEGLLNLFEPLTIAMAVLGVVLGIGFGAVPGLSATLGIALLIPVTFLMPPEAGLIMLAGVYAGAIYGGSISAILLNTPGTPASIVTAWEGNAMARQGQAPLALALSATASGIGGLLSALALIFLTPVVADLALAFGPPEFVALILFSLVIVAAMLSTPLLGNLAGCLLGLALATVGIDPSFGIERFTFGAIELTSGLSLVGVLIGFFCMNQGLALILEGLRGVRVERIEFGHARLGVVARELWRLRAAVGRGSVIGIFLGILPAIGPETTPFTAHALEKRFARRPETFGSGSTQGLVVAEASNNANVGGSLVPLLALGIPGSGAAAVFIGALTLHGLRPGPLLFTDFPTVIYTFFAGFIAVNLFMTLMGLFGARYFAAVLKAPKAVIGTFICFFSVFGTYAVNTTTFDLWVMLGAMLFGFLLAVINMPILPVVLGFILGATFEQNLVVTIRIMDGAADFLGRPIAVGFVALAAGILVHSIWRRATMHLGARDDGTGSKPVSTAVQPD